MILPGVLQKCRVFMIDTALPLRACQGKEEGDWLDVFDQGLGQFHLPAIIY
jgi:hypothetical protein